MLIKDAEFCVVDIETTGLDPQKDKVVELAVVRCSLKDGVDSTGKRSYSKLVNPGIPIPASASAIHHITDDDVSHLSPKLSAIVVGDLVCHDGLIDGYEFAAHNAEFDFSFIPPISNAPVCTCRLARKLWPDLECYSNQFLRYHFKLSIPQHVREMQMHRALPDATVTAFLLIHELNEVLARAENPDMADVGRLVSWIAEPMLLRTIRFGKHKGEKWSDVPKSYLSWMLKNMEDLDIDTRFTAEHYLQNS